MKITVTWSGTDADRVQAQTAQNALEAAGLGARVVYVIDGKQPSMGFPVREMEQQ